MAAPAEVTRAVQAAGGVVGVGVDDEVVGAEEGVATRVGHVGAGPVAVVGDVLVDAAAVTAGAEIGEIKDVVGSVGGDVVEFLLLGAGVRDDTVRYRPAGDIGEDGGDIRPEQRHGGDDDKSFHAAAPFWSAAPDTVHCLGVTGFFGRLRSGRCSPSMMRDPSRPALPVNDPVPVVQRPAA